MLDYLILGALQGIFEWVPISSEGIITLTSKYLFQIENPLSYALFLHLGTLLATLIYFRKDWLEVVQLKNKPLFKFLAYSTIVSLAIGYLIYKQLTSMNLGLSLLTITGIALIVTSYLQKSKRKIKLKQNQVIILTGVLQGLAIIPGFSRSGSTIFGLSFTNLEPEKILKYSYMMSAPVIIVANVYILFQEPVLFKAWPSIILSFIIGLGTLKLIINYSKRINFSKFTFIFGLLCLLGSFVGYFF